MSAAARPIRSPAIGSPGEDGRARLRRFMDGAAADEWRLWIRDGDLVGRHPSGAALCWPLRLFNEQAVARLPVLMERGIRLANAARLASAAAREAEP